MSDLTVGKDILSLCGKCKLSLSHTIMVMKTTAVPKRVMCNTCKSEHAYKDPNAPAKKKVTRKRTKKVEIPISELWMQAIAKTKKKSQNYSIREKFAVGDIIDHSKFGPGIVENVIDSTKIEVMFRHEVKTLMHNKS